MTDSIFQAFMKVMIFSLSFIFALNLLKLNTSWGTLFVVFLAIFLLTFIVFSGSASKKLSIAAVIFVLFFVLAIFSGLIETDLGDGCVKIEGDYVEKNGAIYIKNGTCVITKTVYYGRYPYASLDVKGNGTMEVVILDCNPEFGCDNYFSGVVEVDTEGEIRKIVFKTDMNAISVKTDGDFTHLHGIDNAEKYRTREVKVTVKGEDIWLDNFKA